MATIRDLNDAMRKALPYGAAAGQLLVLTVGISELDAGAKSAVIRKVRDFDAFSADNDPHGEHDFGAIELAGIRVFWKIDYYDRAMRGHSPDAADPAVTCRVLTIMLAEEY